MVPQPKASFKAFLRTGELGPLVVGTPLLQVAAQLGPPRYWEYSYNLSPVPCFWGYDNLEMRFSDRAPYRLAVLKLHDASELTGKSAALSPTLRLVLDGLSGAMKPSDFLREDLWGARKILVEIQLIAGELQLHIVARPIEFIYVISGDDVGDQEALTAAFHRQDWPPIIALFEQASWLYGIYCYSPGEWRTRRWKSPYIEIERHTYLSHVAASQQGTYAGGAG